MTNRRSIRSGTGGSGMWPVVIVLVLLAGVGTGATLWVTGYFDPVETHEGEIAFPSLVRPIKAYERITREDLVDLETKQLKPIWMKPEMVGPGMLRDLSQILGRVAARDKQPGYILTEADLLPKGTRPGVTAGIPPGKRSVSVSVEKVPGLELLRQGDTFDLLAVLPARTDPVSNIEPAKLLGGIKPPDTRAGQLSRQTGIKPLVLGGTMVALTQGSTQSTVGSQPLVVDAGVAANRRNQKDIVATIAVDPEEVTPLTEALGLDVELYCVALSGHADAKVESEEPTSFDGMVAVVATARNIEAYSAIGPDVLADSVTGRLNVYYFSPDQVHESWLTDFGSLVGRVVRQDVVSGSILTDDLLLPPGTRPGLVGGAPPGTVVLPVSASQLKGLDSLSNGDGFAVYVRLPEDMRPAFPQTDWATLNGGRPPQDDEVLQQELRSGVRQIVSSATLVGEVDSGNDSNRETVRFVGIAIPQASVTPLSQFLDEGSELFVVAESGQISTPGDPQRSVAVDPADQTVEQLVAFQAGTDSGQRGQLPTNRPVDGPLNPVPVTARPIAAYAKLTVEDFIDPSTGRPRVMLFPAERVGSDWVKDLNELIDRVATRDIDAGRVIEESVLLPAGSQSGSTAGVPLGLLGMTVNGQQVLGLDNLENLHRGDRFRLVAIKPYDLDALGGTVRRSLSGGDAIQQALATGVLFQRAVVDVLCDEVLLVDFGSGVQFVKQNVVDDTEQTTQTLLTPDGPVRTEQRRVTPQVTEREVDAKSYLLALQPDDVGLLTEALGLGTQILAVPLPGTSAEAMPSSSPVASDSEGSPLSGAELPRPRIVEHIRGKDVSREVWLTSGKDDARAARRHAMSSDDH